MLLLTPILEYNLKRSFQATPYDLKLQFLSVAVLLSIQMNLPTNGDRSCIEVAIWLNPS